MVDFSEQGEVKESKEKTGGTIPVYTCGHEQIVLRRKSSLLPVEIRLCENCKDLEWNQGEDLED